MTRAPAVLGIDLGTTAVKALIATRTGPILTRSCPLRLHSPEPGWAETDPADWWAAVGDLCRELRAAAAERGLTIVGLAATGMVPTVIALDGELRPLRRSIQQNDTRARVEVDEFSRRLDTASLLNRTGSPLTQQSVGPKLAWLARHEPGTWERTTAVAGSYDWLAATLTGKLTMDANWALESGLWELTSRTWAPDLVGLFGATALQWPGVANPGDVLGTLTASAAAHTGLREGTPVYAGGADHVLAALASGTTEPGQLLIKLGGATDVLAPTTSPRTDPRLFLDIHAPPQRYLVNGCTATSGSLIRWFAENLAAGATLEQLDAEAAAIGAGAGGVLALPYFLGEKSPLNDPAARGAFVGLHLGHRRQHLYRALLEANAFAVRHNVDVLHEMGIEITRARITDGGARSNLYCQIIADVLGLKLERVAAGAASATGAAIAAAVGAGVLDGWADADSWATVDRLLTPDDEPIYEAQYAAYRSLHHALTPVAELLQRGNR